MLFNLKNEQDRREYKQYCNSLYTCECIVEVKKKHKTRSVSQNNYLHFCLQYFASEFGYTLEEVKYNIYKQVVNHEIFARQRVNKRGQTVTYLRSSSDLDTLEMTNTIERFRNYSSSVAGLYIPEANEDDAYFEAMKQIAIYEKYL